MKKTVLFYILFFSLPIFASAQNYSIPAQVQEIEEQIYINVEPKFPGPNTDVTFSLEAYGTDLSKADIVWKVNGVITEKGRAKEKIVVTTGAIGKKTIVEISILPINGVPVEKVFTLYPQALDVIWEARTYTPPFYKGKAFLSPEEEVVVAAIPDFRDTNGKFIQPGAVTYKWRNEGEVVSDAIGYGKNFFRARGGILLKPFNILVEATGDDGAKAKNYLTIPFILPSVLLYENNPSYGILFNKSLGSRFTTANIENSFVAIPYFFGTDDKNFKLTYEWFVNDQKIFSSKERPTITLRNATKESGISRIFLRVGHTESFLQEATKNIDLELIKPKTEEGVSLSI